MQSLGVIAPVTVTSSTDRRWLHADERGSIVAVSNSANSATNILSYDEYGIPASTNTGRFGYTGQTWLPEVGLNYYKARMYSPTLGRFMQTDPIGYGDGVNWYDYVDGDPVNRVDPSGLKTKECDGDCQQRIAESRQKEALLKKFSEQIKYDEKTVDAAMSFGPGAIAKAGTAFAQAAGKVLKPTSIPKGTLGGPKAPKPGMKDMPKPQTGKPEIRQPEKVPAEYRAAQAAKASESRNGFWGKVADLVEALRDAF